jgi:hypothetical protein
MDMPTLVWIAFWSSAMGVGLCWQDLIMPPSRKPVPVNAKDSLKRPHS